MPTVTLAASPTANAMVDAWADLLDNGYLRIYNSGATLLAELRFNATAFGGGSGGVATANAFTADSSANATGTADNFKAYQSDGTTLVFEGGVSTSGAALNLDSVSIVAGGNVQVNSMTLTQPLS